MTRQEREELNLLSKQAFGTSSRWQKLVNDGVKEPHQRERKVMVPTRGGIREKTFVDKKDVLRRYTVQEVRKIMTDMVEGNKNTESLANINLPVTKLENVTALSNGSTVTLTQNETNQNN